MIAATIAGIAGTDARQPERVEARCASAIRAMTFPQNVWTYHRQSTSDDREPRITSRRRQSRHQAMRERPYGKRGSRRLPRAEVDDRAA
jgi:hypothetical protein